MSCQLVCRITVCIVESCWFSNVVCCAVLVWSLLSSSSWGNQWLHMLINHMMYTPSTLLSAFGTVKRYCHCTVCQPSAALAESQRTTVMFWRCFCLLFTLCFCAVVQASFLFCRELSLVVHSGAVSAVQDALVCRLSSVLDALYFLLLVWVVLLLTAVVGIVYCVELNDDQVKSTSAALTVNQW